LHQEPLAALLASSEPMDDIHGSLR
jgi:hypothetical protein